VGSNLRVHADASASGCGNGGERGILTSWAISSAQLLRSELRSELFVGIAIGLCSMAAGIAIGIRLGRA
jgi:hypothetical protein